MLKALMTAGVAALALAAASFGGPAAAQDAPKLETEVERFSYAIGRNMARTLQQQGMQAEFFSAEAFALAIEDQLAGTDPRLSDDEMQAAVQAIVAQMEAKAAAEATAGRAEGAAFLEENAKAPGVVVTQSGLQYRIDRAGDGAKPGPGATVEVHYSGRLLNGKQFDSSYDRGEPAQFPVNRVIAGWTEALQLMSVGAKWELWIPSDLAYGPRGAGGDIPPHAVLNFTVELLDIVE